MQVFRKWQRDIYLTRLVVLWDQLHNIIRSLLIICKSDGWYVISAEALNITMPWMQKKRFSPTQIKSIVSATRKVGTIVFSCLVGWSRHTLHLVHNQRNGHQKMIGSSLILIWRGQSLRVWQCPFITVWHRALLVCVTCVTGFVYLCNNSWHQNWFAVKRYYCCWHCIGYCLHSTPLSWYIIGATSLLFLPRSSLDSSLLVSDSNSNCLRYVKNYRHSTK